VVCATRLNVNGAQAEVTVDSGAIRATGDFQWSAGTSTNVSAGTVRLNGGAIEAKRFLAVSTAGTNRLYLNGGTMRALDSRTDFFYNLTPPTSSREGQRSTSRRA